MTMKNKTGVRRRQFKKINVVPAGLCFSSPPSIHHKEISSMKLNEEIHVSLRGSELSRRHIQRMHNKQISVPGYGFHEQIYRFYLPNQVEQPTEISKPAGIPVSIVGQKGIDIHRSRRRYQIATNVQNKISEIGGYDIEWVGEKSITRTGANHGFYLPSGSVQVIEEKLTETEVKDFKENRKIMQVLIVGPKGSFSDVAFQYWPTVGRYLFNRNWLDFVKCHDVRYGVHTAAIWCFRRGDNGNIAFAIQPEYEYIDLH